MKRIALALVALLAALAAVSLVTQGTLWLTLVPLLGATIGVPMGLLYPFPLLTKLTLIGGLAASAVTIVWGLRHHTQLRGQIFAVAGVVCWCLFGLLGLGTGT